MIQTSEAVSLGHPDSTTDFIVSHLLDAMIRIDPKARVALECQAKDNFVTLGGEVTTVYPLTQDEIDERVRDAVRKIGYTESYAATWGADNTIDPSRIQVTAHIGQQSPDIAQGVDADGWGDQGIFWGMATGSKATNYMPLDHYVARKLCNHLYDCGREGRIRIGLDIKTQVTVDGGKVKRVIVAAPVIDGIDFGILRAHVVKWLADEGHEVADENIIVNGTGAYVRHSTMGDCGTTGRKLAVDFYGGACRIGGGNCWGKDPSKADVTLNVYARERALRMLNETNYDTVYCAISCCIGRKEIELAFFDATMRQIASCTEARPAPEIIAELGLNRPVYAFKKSHGLFETPNG